MHSCISPLPVAVPLSFPASLAGQPGTTTAVAAGSGGVARPCLPRSAKAPAAPAPGALTRLTATSGFQRLLQQAARDARRLGATTGGQACLDEWGYASSDEDELREVLLGMAGKYEDPEGLE